MFRYGQFCPLARSAEIVGQRWSLPILRELFVGPQRFSDLRSRLGGAVSSSVLASRLSELEEMGLIAQRRLAPPAPATVYALTTDGEALWPSFRELTRFGVRYLVRGGMLEGDHMEPDWVVLALRVFARSDPTPERRIAFRIPGRHGDHVVRVQGGPAGTRVVPGESDAAAVDVTLRAEPSQMLPILAGVADPAALAESGLLEIEGDLAAAADVSQLFEVDLGLVASAPDDTPDESASPNPIERNPA